MNAHANTVPFTTSTAPPIPARSTQSTIVAEGSLYSSSPLPSYSAASTTAAPAKEPKKKKKKKKIVIPEHLANADLEWLKAKQKAEIAVLAADPATSAPVEVGNASGSVQNTTSVSAEAAVSQGVDETGGQLHGETTELNTRVEPARVAHPVSAAVATIAAAAAEDPHVESFQSTEAAIEHPIPPIHPQHEPEPNIDSMDIDVPPTQASDPTHPQLAEQETEFARNVDAMISDMPVGIETVTNEVLAGNVIPRDDVVIADGSQTAPSAGVDQQHPSGGVPAPIDDIQPPSASESAGLYVERSIKEADDVSGDKTVVCFLMPLSDFCA